MFVCSLSLDPSDLLVSPTYFFYIRNTLPGTSDVAMHMLFLFFLGGAFALVCTSRDMMVL